MEIKREDKKYSALMSLCGSAARTCWTVIASDQRERGNRIISSHETASLLRASIDIATQSPLREGERYVYDRR